MDLALPEYFYVDAQDSQQRRGPASVSALCALHAGGSVTHETLVWTSSMADWQPFRQVPLLTTALLKQQRASNSNTKKRAAAADPDDAAAATATTANSTEETEQQPEQQPEEQKKKKRKKPRKRPVTAVYITNVPADATEEEVLAHFSRCGLVQMHPMSREPCVKLYRDDAGKLKGDAMVVYKLRPSVDNAVRLLHEAELRLGQPASRLSVEEATSQPGFSIDKTYHNANSTNVSDTMQKAVEMRRKEQEQALSWNEEGVSDTKGLRLVEIKNLFDPAEARLDPNFKQDLHDDLRAECATLGEVKKVIVFPEHREGVVIVKFASSRTAELCVEKMNGRWFSKRKLFAGYWDGVTDYRPKKSGDEDEGRLDAFASSLG